MGALALGNSLGPSQLLAKGNGEYGPEHPSVAQFGRRRGMPFENGILYSLVVWVVSLNVSRCPRGERDGESIKAADGSPDLDLLRIPCTCVRYVAWAFCTFGWSSLFPFTDVGGYQSKSHCPIN